jgi:23S rRNA (cytidine1920-2'-O)/16S rRNA (cytidine1409-2'-O)-methyltransferase
VRDHTTHARVLHEVVGFAANAGFAVRGLIASPLKGPAGNTEFLAWLSWGQPEPGIDLDQQIQSVIAAL